MATELETPQSAIKNDDGTKEPDNNKFLKNPYTFPWWLVTMIGLWIWVIYQMTTDSRYLDAFDQIKDGIPLTIGLAASSYFFAIIIGLLTGMMRAYPPTPPDTNKSPRQEFIEALLGLLNPNFYLIGTAKGRVERRKFTKILHVILHNLISLYIEFMRGIPPIVFLLIAGFIIVPAVRDPITQTLGVVWIPFHNNILLPILNTLLNHDLSIAPPLLPSITLDYTLTMVADESALSWGANLYNDIINGIFHEYTPLTEVVWRGRDPATAIAGLSLIYGAFLSEVFRGGIQAIPRGQTEAAKSVGMTSYQTMRYVVVPQAIRNVLPELGNNLISMIKDTALVTILGTSEITQEARRWSGSQFTYLETYAVLSLIYLTMTVSGSLFVQAMERRLRQFAVR
ncbi:MAG: amino acid ABC transporter permease [Phototrophicaceae bacterium]